MGFLSGLRTAHAILRYTNNMPKKPLTDEERQAFIDSLPNNEVNENAEQTFKDAIARAAQPKQSAPEKSTEADDDCNDTQTRSDKVDDISH